MKLSKALAAPATVTGHVYLSGRTVMVTVRQSGGNFHVIRRPDCTYLHLADEGYVVPDNGRRASMREMAVASWMAQVSQLEPPF